MNLRFSYGVSVIAIILSSTAYAADWNYDLEGQDWEGTCAAGFNQSPIDIVDWKKNKDLSVLGVRYINPTLNVVNNGHTIQVNVDNGSSLILDGKEYTLLQFHFHTPSEHAKNGLRSPMEVHFVHQSADGELAVIGNFIDEGAANDVLEKILGLATHEVGSATSGEFINPTKLLSDNLKYHAYSGSLTTPPCTEGLRWQVINAPITASFEQIEHFRGLVHAGHNARSLQSIGDRTIEKSGN